MYLLVQMVTLGVSVLNFVQEFQMFYELKELFHLTWEDFASTWQIQKMRWI